MMKIAILGSTGSIGTQTLDIVREQGDIQVTAIAAGSNIKNAGRADERVSSAAGMRFSGGRPPKNCAIARRI